MDRIVIPMKLRSWPMVACLVFFGPGAYFLFFAALEADPGTESRTWIAFACSATFALVSAGLLIAGQRSKAQLILAEDELVLPKGWFSKRPPRIRYDEITTMDEMKVSGQRMLAFNTSSGSYTINEILLPRRVALSELKADILRRVAIARGVGLR